jgi:hypothetical protein
MRVGLVTMQLSVAQPFLAVLFSAFPILAPGMTPIPHPTVSKALNIFLGTIYTFMAICRVNVRRHPRRTYPSRPLRNVQTFQRANVLFPLQWRHGRATDRVGH